MFNTHPSDRVITVADGIEYPVQCDVETILSW
jgi:hypothetical protein